MNYKPIPRASLIFISIIVMLYSCQSGLNNEKTIAHSKPNIIFILADDLGYGDLGCYGQELIETPNIDLLAEEGIKFTQHYSGAPVCAPARCVLLTGKHSGHAYIRGNDEWNSRGDVWNYKAMLADSTLEGQRPLPSNTVTIAKLLQDAGYKTGMTGKWGLGAPHTESIPTDMGFDYFLGYNCQRQAHTYYPVHLYKNENRIYLNNDTIAPNVKLPKGSNPLSPQSYSEFQLNEYAPDIMFTGMIDFIDKNKDEPFFFYWASPIPHVPLQAPKAWVDYYIMKFGNEEPYLGDKGYFPNRYPNATYAAMISYLDEKVGLLIDKLKKEGIYENTILIFTSDNGPTYAGGVNANYFNSAGPFINDYGYTKGFVHEGGIRVPLIVSWPNEIDTFLVSDHISSFSDIMPTFCDIATVDIPEESDGISFFPTIMNKGNQSKHEYLYWEFPEYNGQQAIRYGEWKAIRKNIQKGNLEIELYNLVKDPQELNNLASSHLELIEKIRKFMIESHEKSLITRFQLSNIDN